MLKNYKKYPRIVPKNYYKKKNWIHYQQEILLMKEQMWKRKEVAHILNFKNWSTEMNQHINNTDHPSYSLWIRKILLLSLFASLRTFTLDQANLQGKEIMKTNELQEEENMENENKIPKGEKEMENQYVNEIALQQKEFIDRKISILKEEEEFSIRKSLFEEELQKLIALKNELESNKYFLFKKKYLHKIKKNFQILFQ